MSKLLAIVPAYNEAGAIAGTIVATSAPTLPTSTCVVVDDGSTDDDRAAAARAPAPGHPPPVQPRHRRRGAVAATSTRSSTATTSRSRSTATASTTRATSRELLEHLRADPDLNMVTGSRFLATQGDGLPLLGVAPRSASGSSPASCRSSCGRPVTDPTSGFRMTDRRGIELFARDYPHDYPEVEAVLMFHAHRLSGDGDAGADARAPGRRVVDRLDAVGLLHDQGAAGRLRRPAARARPDRPAGRRRARRRGARASEPWTTRIQIVAIIATAGCS